MKLTKRSDELAEQLLEKIHSGVYKPSQKLPTEAQLGEAYGVSRTTVREAMRDLSASGIIEIRHGSGTYVVEKLGQSHLKPFFRWLRQNRLELQGIMEIRGALDELATVRVIKYASEDQIREIQKTHESFLQAIKAEDADLIYQLDIKFHLMIAKAAAIPMLTHLLNELNEAFKTSRFALFYQSGRARKSAMQHEAIVQALLREDPEAARTAVRNHIQSSIKSLKQVEDA